MKRKILSLALALMMILSVVAALPVSADTVEPIILAAADFSHANAGGPVDKTYTPADNFGWVPNGHILTSSTVATTSTTVDKVNVPVSGYYDLTVAARMNGTTNAAKQSSTTTKLYCDDEWKINFAASMVADGSIHQTNAGVVYLEAGEHTIKLEKTEKGAYYLHGIKLSYRGTEAPGTIVVAATSRASETKMVSTTAYDTTPSTNCGIDWLQNGALRFYSASSATFEVNVLKAGTYQLTLAAKVGACTTKIKVSVNGGTKTTATFPVPEATTSLTAVAGLFNLEAGKNTIVLSDASHTASTSYPYLHGLKLDILQSYNVTANATEGGTVSAASTPVLSGESATITATPNAGYLFDGWYEGETKVGSELSLTVENVTSDRTFTAKFKANPNIFLEPRAGSVSNGNYLFRNTENKPTYDGMTWGDGEGDSLRLYYGQASFNYYSYSTLTAGREGFYDVYIAAGTKTGAKARFETLVNKVEGNLQATASEYTVKENNIGYIYLPANEPVDYKLWLTSGSGSGNDTYVFDIELRYKEVQPVSYKITALAGEGGSVIGTGAVVAGGSTTLTATPNAGYVFEGWYQGDTKVGSELLYKISDVQADATYTAKFDEGVIVELEDYITGATVGKVTGSSAGKMVYTGWGGVGTKPTVADITVTIPKSGYYNVEYVVNASTNYGSLTTFYLDGEELAKNTGTAVQSMSYYGNSTVNQYAALKKYRVTKYLEAGDYALTLDQGLAISNGNVAPDVYKFQYDYIAFVYQGAAYTITANAATGGTATGATVAKGENATITATANTGYMFDGWYNASDVKVSSDATFVIENVTADATYTAKFNPCALIDATSMTKANGVDGNFANVTANANNIFWAAATGKRMCATSNGIGLKGTTSVPSTGWYNVSVAYAASVNDADIGLSLSGVSVNLTAPAPSTGSNSNLAELALGQVYLSADEEYEIQAYLQANSSGWSGAIYTIKLEKATTLSDTVIINGGLPVNGSYIEKGFMIYGPANDDVSWATVGSIRINGGGSWGEYKAYVPTSGYYKVSVAAGMSYGAYAKSTITINGTEVVTEADLNTTAVDISNNMLNPSETVVTMVYLEAGEITVRYDGVLATSGIRLMDIKLEKEELPTAYNVRIVDADSEDVSSVTGGKKVYAEVAVPETDTQTTQACQLILTQYAGSGAERTMVKTTFQGAAQNAVYTVNGLKVYRKEIATSATAGDIKAMFWVAGATSFTPLAAYDVASVN